MIKVILGNEIIPVLTLAIRGAEKIIQVAMYEWGWYQGQHSGLVQDINREVCTKAKHGVAVNVVLHQEGRGRPLRGINYKSEKNLRIYGAVVKYGWPGTPVHAKVWIIDRRLVVLGSHNVSVRASKVNYEASVMFDDEGEVKRVVAWFEELWGKAR